MKIKVTGENNFFLFQDIYYWFGKALVGERYLPIKNKHRRTDYYHFGALEFIYDSWLAVLYEKLKKAGLTDKGRFLHSKLTDWMITTNIAITTAQKGRGRRDIPSYELEYIQQYKPSFLIEHSDDFELYFIHLDGDMKEAFMRSLDFYNLFKDMNPKVIIDGLMTLYNVKEKDIEEEIETISEHFEPDLKFLDTFEVMEE